MREIYALIYDLSKVSNLKFVGSTSLLLQGFLLEITDIDVLVQDMNEITQLFEIIEIEEPLYKLSGRRRAYFIRENIMVDIFVRYNNEETILVNEYAVCSTIQAQINFVKSALELNISDEVRKQFIAQINYLETLR